MYKTTQGWLESYTPNNALLSNIKHNVDYLIHFYCSPWEITPKKGCWSWSLWPSLMPPLCGGYPLKEFFYLKSKPSLSLLCCISAQGPVVINVGVRPVNGKMDSSSLQVLLWSLEVVSLDTYIVSVHPAYDLLAFVRMWNSQELFMYWNFVYH